MIKKTVKKLEIISLALMMTTSMLGSTTASVFAKGNDGIATAAVDESGYNVLGSVASVSNSDNIVTLDISTGERVRYTFLKDNMFRMYMAPLGEEFQEYPTPNSSSHTATITNKTDSQFETEYGVRPTVSENATTVTISTGKIIIEINKADSVTKVKKADGTVIWEEAAPLKYKSGSTYQTLKTDANEYFYGGGTQNGRFSHKGNTIKIAITNTWVDKSVTSPNPFYWSTDGYGVVRNTWKPGEYDFGNSGADTVKTTHNEKRFDAYFFIDDTPVEILGDYYELTGKPAELPEYAAYLGHLNCYNRDFWTEVSEGTSGAVKLGDKWYKESQSYSEGSVKETLLGTSNVTAQQVIEDHKAYDMPLGWFLPNDGYGCGYGQTTSQAGDIDNLKDFSDYAIANGIQTGLWTQSNLWPADSSNPQKGERDIYKEVEAGVHSVKTDVAWVGAGYSMALNGVSVAYDAIATKSGLKPNIVTLNGWAGTQRYGGIWTGDQSGGQWEYIRFHIPTYIGTALSGQPNIGSDMDGIFGGANLIAWTRDFQWKAFTTFMLDMDGWGSNQKSPWALGEDGTSINRAYLKLKAKLMPYNNTISHEATAEGGLPMIRAMMLEEKNSYTLGTDTQYQYMWGNNFLIAPIYQNTAANGQGDDVRNGIYLPSTSDIWIDYFTGEQYRGGQVLNNFDAPLWKLPVFVKNGSIIPMYPENNNPEAKTTTNSDGLDRSQRIVEFFPSGESSFTAYEDDGKTLGGSGVYTELKSKVDGDTVTLTAEKTNGSYTGMVRERFTEFVVNVSKKPTSVTGNVAGSDVTFTEVTSQADYDAATGNVYFYNENPSIFVKEYASADSSYASTTETTEPKLYVKSAGKNDITAHGITVVVEGFENNQDLGEDVLDTTLDVPTGLAEVSKTDSEINVAWDAVTDAASYDIEVDGIVIRNIIDPEYNHSGLGFLTDHTYRVRTVAANGHFSDWSDLITIQTADNPYRNVPDATATWDHGDQWGAVANAFDHDTNTMFHSTNAVTPDQMMTIDLGAAYQLDKFTYQPRMDNKGNGTVKRMNVYSSLDGVSYKKVWDGESNPAWTYDTDNMDVADIKEVDLDGVKARYLRLSVLESTGGFFSASELTTYKKDGTDAWVVGDVNNSGDVNENDLVFYENYVGLKPVDNDWDYSALGNINGDEIIDAYDISFVARMLGTPITNPVSGVNGKIQIIPSKTDIKAGDIVTLDIFGIGLENVNAFSVEIPVDNDLFEIANFGSATLATAFMRNFSKTRIHNNGAIDNYVCFTNVGKQNLISGTGSIATVTIKATADFTWDTKPTQAILVGQDLSTVDAIIDETTKPVAPDTENILGVDDIASITFDNDVETDMDGSELWQQTNWKDLLFDGDRSGAMAEFKWYFSGKDNIAAVVKLPTDMKFTFAEKQPLSKVKVYNRVSSNGRVTSIKAVAYSGTTEIDLGTFDSAQDIFEFTVPAGSGTIDRVVITPLTSVGEATGTTTGSVENRMLSLYEIEFVTDSKVNATGITFDSTSETVARINEVVQVAATVAPDNVSNPFYDITSSDTNIATVTKVPSESGYYFLVKGVSAGKVTLTATSEDGSFTDTLEFEVLSGVNSTKINKQIESFNALHKNLYTEASYNAVKDLVDSAIEALAKDDVTQEEIDTLTVNIAKALDEIKFKGSDESKPSSANLIDQNKLSRFDESSMSAVEQEHAGYVIDGDPDTIWHSNYSASYSLPQYVTIDLGSIYNLEQVDMLPRQNNSNGQITHYRIEVSTDEGDDKTFTPVVEGYFETEGGTLVNPGIAKEVKFDPTPARYVRFIAIESVGSNEASANKYASIAELNFYGVSGLPSYDEIVAEAEEIIANEELYTTSTFAAFMESYEALKALKNPTDEELSLAIADVRNKINDLDLRASSTVLDSLKAHVAAYKAMEPNYSEVEFAELKAAIEAAEAILAKGDNDISTAEAVAADAAMVLAASTLQGVSVDELKANLAEIIAIANETLASSEIENVRPSKVEALEKAVAAGQALIDEDSNDSAKLHEAIENIVKAHSELWEVVDKAEINSLIETAEGITGNYTSASIAALKEAIKAAKAVAANEDATLAEVNEACAALREAIDGLVELADKDKLADEIAKAKRILANIDSYISTSVAGLDKLVASAEKLFKNESATQAEVDAMTAKLQKAIKGAEKRANFSKLEKAVKEAEAINTSKYTADSVKKLKDAIKAAKAVLKNKDASQSDVEKALAVLNKAKVGLKVEPNSSTSTNQIDNNKNNVSVIGKFPVDIQLIVEDLAADMRANIIAKITNKDAVAKYKFEKIFDIYMLRNGSVYTPEGNFTVKIKLSDELKAKRYLGIVYISDDGKATTIPSKVVDGYITFTTNHNSYYAIVSGDSPIVDTATTSTMPVSSIPAFILLGAVLIFVTKKMEKVLED